MRIGNLIINSKALLAPLAGVSNRPFRVLAIKAGAAITYTEMVSSEGVFRNQAKTKGMMAFKSDEQPLGIQLFGANPDVMKKAAEVTVTEFHPDLIDIKKTFEEENKKCNDLIVSYKDFDFLDNKNIKIKNKKYTLNTFSLSNILYKLEIQNKTFNKYGKEFQRDMINERFKIKSNAQIKSDSNSADRSSSAFVIS